jgi:hypothetical protein
MKPWEIICTMPPSNPIAAPCMDPVFSKIRKAMKKPKVTNPMCEIEE